MGFSLRHRGSYGSNPFAHRRNTTTFSALTNPTPDQRGVERNDMRKLMSDNVDLFVRLRWCCGLYVGAPKWHGTERYEPLECEHEFETTEPSEEWEEGICSATCHGCGRKLSMADDHATLIDGHSK